LTSFIKFWIWLSALASAAGWTLSALGQLNRVGYVVFAALALAVWVWWWRTSEKRERNGVVLSKPDCGGARHSVRVAIGFLMADFARMVQSRWRARSDAPYPWNLGRFGQHARWKRRSWNFFWRRFRRFLPLSFALLSLLVLLGGLLYAPSNHTGLSYRVPRVLHWLSEGQWHWIHTPNYRLNNRACGIEWLSAPMLLFSKSDRGLFLLNFLPFLMLPGLVFSLFTRLGVRVRVAWRWMWLLPTGYTFLVQAGSLGNDTFPTVYALAALDFACRARVSRRVSDVFLSVLAAALLVGAKASNLPLLMPWAIAMLGVWRPGAAGSRRREEADFFDFRRVRLLMSAATVAVLALAASFVPTAILNMIYCGDWSGLVLEHSGMDMKNPLVGVWGNGLLFLSNNYVPPFFPVAGWYNQSVTSWLPQIILAPMSANFEADFLRLWELPTEDWAGLGFGVSVLVAASVLAALRRGLRPSAPIGVAASLPGWLRGGVLFGSWVALLAYCVKSGMVTPARLISPYYPLLIAPLLVLAGHADVVRQRWWRCAEVAVVVMAFGVLIVTPARPLWPAQTLLSQFAKLRPESRLLRRASSVYSVYSSRPDPLADVRALLPREASVVGFIGTGDDMDISLWRPYGSRKVEHFTLDDPADMMRGRHVEYVVLGGLNLAFEHRTLESWLQETGGELVGTVMAVVKVSEGPQPWHVVRIP
jgi:hypothetical protein